MNKIGFNVLAWSANMSDDLKPILDRLKKIGYDGAEFFVGSRMMLLTNESESIAEILG
jgi:D-psicose/D-tagatose/L-ribulose 3-epimerase